MPDLKFVIEKVSFIIVFAFKIDLEPFEEFARKDEQMRQEIVVKRCVNYQSKFIVSKVDSFLKLFLQFHLDRLCIMHLDL